jgi:hypothetical protein
MLNIVSVSELLIKWDRYQSDWSIIEFLAKSAICLIVLSMI